MPTHPSDPSALASSASRADLNPLVESPVNPTHIAELESVRGIAALLVVMFHAPGWGTGKEFIGFIQNGYLMVDLFFVISGFVIYKAYATHLNSWDALWCFQFLRFGRLYPVHLIFLLFFLITIAAPWQEIRVAFFEQLFLVQALGPTGNAISFNYPAWSISVEFYTYFLFGLITLFLGRKKKLFLTVILLISGLAFWSLFASELYGFRDLLRGLTGFFSGCIVCAFTNRIKFRLPSWTVGVCALLIFLFLQYKPNKVFLSDPLIFILTSLLIISLVCSGKGICKTILHSRPLLALGAMSYSLYMAQLACIFLFEGVLRAAFHKWPVIAQVEKELGISLVYPNTFGDGLIKYACFFVVLLVVSQCVYQWVEKPCREASRRQIHQPKLVVP